MRRVVFVNRFYWPSEAATSQILTDLAVRLVDRETDVHVVTSRRAGSNSEGSLPRREVRDGVTIHRVATTGLGQWSILGRAIDYATFYVTASLKLFGLLRADDRVLVKTDPPLMSVPASAVAALRRARLIVWHQDLFPEVAEALGVVRRNGFLSRPTRWLRDRSLRRAETNVVISNSMAEKVSQRGIPRQRVRVIPNWCDDAVQPVPSEDNSLRSEWGLTGRFVVGYSGNLGRVHQAQRVAALVRRTAEIDNLTWLFIGGGVGMHWVEDLQDVLSPKRLRILPGQPRSLLSRSLSVADMHLISLDPACEGLVVPSKLYGVMAVGRPVLNLGAADGAVAAELGAHGFGVTIDPFRPDDWCSTVLALRDDPERLSKMGANAQRAYRRGYRPEHRFSSWDSLLAEKEPVAHTRSAIDDVHAAAERVG